MLWHKIPRHRRHKQRSRPKWQVMTHDPSSIDVIDVARRRLSLTRFFNEFWHKNYPSSIDVIDVVDNIRKVSTVRPKVVRSTSFVIKFSPQKLWHKSCDMLWHSTSSIFQRSQWYNISFFDVIDIFHRIPRRSTSSTSLVEIFKQSGGKLWHNIILL